VVTYDAFGGYGHPDHIRAHEITTAAAAASPDVARVFHSVRSLADVATGVTALVGVPDLPFRTVEPEELAVVPDETITTVVDITEHLPAKLRALRAHATQISVWQDGDGHTAYALSNGLAQPVLEREHYVLARGPAEGAATDLFGGLGIAGTDES
jgi:N-acetyl-1-D-myo-inositol-2-amino-2-deoxy-alpha-D-glucopyranoside deacetylase